MWRTACLNSLITKSFISSELHHRCDRTGTRRNWDDSGLQSWSRCARLHYQITSVKSRLLHLLVPPCFCAPFSLCAPPAADIEGNFFRFGSRFDGSTPDILVKKDKKNVFFFFFNSVYQENSWERNKLSRLYRNQPVKPVCRQWGVM